MAEPAAPFEALAASAFDAHPDPQLVVNADCEVFATNRALREVIALARGPRALAETLVLGAGEFLRDVREGVGAAIRNQTPSRPLEVALSSSLSFDVRIAPLSREHALLILRRRETCKSRERFGFTPMEARVTDLLCQGLSATRIAKQLGISIETVRCHLKQAFVKAGVHRQAELVAVVLGA